jgi:2-isopropylmalate synthase
MTLDIYDCTLREGEQAEGASFSLNERIELVKLLDNFGVDYIELGWPLSSNEILESFKLALPIVKKSKIVAFGSTSIRDNVDDDENLNSIVKSCVKYACIFGKTNILHIKKQLKITPEENLNKIKDSIEFLNNKGITVFYDAEHYFDGFINDKKYAVETLITAANAGAKKLILCDTNGGMIPSKVKKIIKETVKELDIKGVKTSLGVHFHNDSGLALANTIISLPYISHVQGTINGIGERLGNLNFSEFLPVYIKKIKGKLNVDLKDLKKVNEETYRLCGIEMPDKSPFVGKLAFAHKAGVHIDATLKGASYEHEIPEEFGNKRVIIMNTLGGRSSIINIAQEFGYEIDKNHEDVKEKIKELFKELKVLEKQGYRIGLIKAEQYLLLNKYFDDNKDIFRILEWEIKSEMRNGKEFSYFKSIGKIGDELFEGSSVVEGGPIDAAFKTLKKILKQRFPRTENLNLIDFHVSIARQNKEESTVRTRIDFKDDVSNINEVFSTVGVDRNILGSAILSLEKGFRYYILNSNRSGGIENSGN